MISNRDKLINNAVMALRILNKEHGFDVISRQTLVEIMEKYARVYNSPSLPGERRTIIAPPQNTGIPLPVTPLPDNVVSMFGARPPMTKQQSDESQALYNNVVQQNADNEKRLRAQRDKDNREILGPKGRR